MYDRSAASASSKSVPANALPGSMTAKKLRADRSTRLSVRLMKCTTSRTSQCDCVFEQHVVGLEDERRDRPRS